MRQHAIEEQSRDEIVAAGRAAYDRRLWRDAYEHLQRADEQAPLDAEDLERLAMAAYAINLDTEPSRAWTRAHHAWVKRGETRRAARSAFQNASVLFSRGEMAPALGWVARGRRIVDEIEDEGPEHGWLVLMTALPHMFASEDAVALPLVTRANAIAERFDDMGLITQTRQVLGHTLIQLGRISEGLTLVDEAMVAVTSGDVDPMLTGIAYCQLIQTCQNIFDLRRAREWTESLRRWCESQPDLVPIQGDCLVYRSEMCRQLGAWPDAESIAEQACEALAAQRAWATLGAARYQLGEVARLRGELEAAEEQYLLASQYGFEPEPGMSLLQLARGRTDAARAALQRRLDETERPFARARVLPAYIEVVLAAGDLDAAEAAGRELAATAADLDTPFIRAASAYADGAILLERGDGQGALNPLRNACRWFQELDAPYEAARARGLTALAYRLLKDEESATRELDAARTIFARLGATADLERIDRLRAPAQRSAAGLSARECEVLALVARGMTNRQISEKLVLSENTVARHLQNIFSKLGVSSRAAATAYAFENRLV